MCKLFYARKGLSMKHNKILGLLGIAAALTLVACGGGNNASKKPSGNTAKTSKSSKPSTSRVPTKSVSVASANLVKKADNKVYVQVTGTETLYKTGELKWAWGVVTHGAAEATWVLGAETPAATDFTAVTFEAAAENDPTAKPFTVELCLTDMATLPVGMIEVYGGDTADTYAALEMADTTVAVKDAKNNYYIRDDEGAGVIAVDALPPVGLEKATIVTNPEGKTGVYAKIGGANNIGYTDAQLAELTPYVNFQSTTSWSNTRVQNSETNPDELFYKIEGQEVFLFVHIDFMVTGGANRYNTHLNFAADTKQDCKMSVDILENNVYTFEEANRKITVYSNTKGGRDQQEFWSNLGFIVELINEETPEGGELA